jgi:hypothetical protein
MSQKIRFILLFAIIFAIIGVGNAETTINLTHANEAEFDGKIDVGVIYNGSAGTIVVQYMNDTTPYEPLGIDTFFYNLDNDIVSVSETGWSTNFNGTTADGFGDFLSKRSQKPAGTGGITSPLIFTLDESFSEPIAKNALNHTIAIHMRLSDGKSTWLTDGLVPVPSIDIEKSTNGEDADEKPGPLLLNRNNVEWTYNVTNTGYYNLTDVNVTDDKLGQIGTIPLLQAGQSYEFTINGIANPGQYANNATAVGTSPSGANVSDSDPSHYFGVNATIGDFLWNDTANNNGIQEAGEPGIAGVNVSLYNFSDDALLQTTKTNESGYYNFSVPAGQYYIKFDLLNGYLFSPDNQGNDRNRDSDVDPFTAKTGKIDVQTTDFNMSFDVGMFKAIPGIDVEKFTNGEDADEAPGPYIRLNYEVRWVYNVTNTGNVNLTNIDVTDDELGLIGTIPLLQPGESRVLTRNATASLGQYENTATSVGVPPIGPNVTDSDMSHYFGHDSQPNFDVPTANPLLIIGMLGLAVAMVLRREED